MEAGKRRSALPFVPSVAHIGPLYAPPKGQQALAPEARSHLAIKARLRNGRSTQASVTSRSPSPRTLPALKGSTDVTERVRRNVSTIVQHTYAPAATRRAPILPQELRHISLNFKVGEPFKRIDMTATVGGARAPRRSGSIAQQQQRESSAALRESLVTNPLNNSTIFEGKSPPR